MNIVFHTSVLAFLHKLDVKEAADVFRLVETLRQRGHTLTMPISKPIGDGLHELRTHGKPAFRVLYGFCGGEAVLLLALKKQKSALNRRDIKTALERLRLHCRL